MQANTEAVERLRRYISENYLTLLSSVGRSLAVDSDTVAEAFANVTIKAVQAVLSGGEVRNMQSYLFISLRNECRRLLADRRKFDSLTEDLPADDAESSGEWMQIQNRVIARFGLNRATLFAEYVQNRHTCRSLAVLMGMPHGRVKKELAEVKNFIRTDKACMSIIKKIRRCRK